MSVPGDSRAFVYQVSFADSRQHFEAGPIRPPSEGRDQSLLIRVNRNCPWNRCLFCSTYKGSRFEYRSLAEVEADIAVVKTLAGALKAASWAMGLGGNITQEVIGAIIRGTPEAYGREVAEADRAANLQSLSMVAGWLASGAKTVFLQDANAPIMRVPELVAVLKQIRDAFPAVERVTSYARSKTINQRTVEELRLLRSVGLSRLHIGLESGNDEVLAFMEKGVNGDQHIDAGRKVKAAGIALSEYLMPGLGGRRLSRAHAQDSARVLNAIDPDFIRLRSLIVRSGSGLDAAGFEELTEDEVVDEIALFVERLDCNALLVSDQMSNLLMEVEGQLPQDRDKILRRIERYRTLPPIERMRVRLQRRLRSFLAVYGGVPDEVNAQVEIAVRAMEQQAGDVEVQVDRAIKLLKGGFV